MFEAYMSVWSKHALVVSTGQSVALSAAKSFISCTSTVNAAPSLYISTVKWRSGYCKAAANRNKLTPAKVCPSASRWEGGSTFTMPTVNWRGHRTLGVYLSQHEHWRVSLQLSPFKSHRPAGGISEISASQIKQTVKSVSRGAILLDDFRSHAAEGSWTHHALQLPSRKYI